MLKTKFGRVLTGLAVALGLTVGSVAAAAPANAAVVTSWPAYTTNASPSNTANVGSYYSNGKVTQISISTASCPSGKAEQMTFYPWTTISGSRQPVWSKPVKFEKCIAPALPAANSAATVVAEWPAYTSVYSPKRTDYVGAFYHNTNTQKTVTTNKCASGKATQGTFYRWGMISGGYTPLTSQPVYLLKCL